MSCVQVVFFKPMKTDGLYNSIKNSFGVTDSPGIDAGFYFDLTARSIDAVERMKSSGSWPDLTYTKCSQFVSDKPTPRSLNLAASIQVLITLN